MPGVDSLQAEEGAQGLREKSFTVGTTMDKIIRTIGEKIVRDYVVEKSSEIAKVTDYEYSRWNVVDYWTDLFLFVLVFAALSTLTLEFIDKDKR